MAHACLEGGEVNCSKCGNQLFLNNWDHPGMCQLCHAHGGLMDGKLPFLDYINVHFVGRTVTRAWFQNKNVLVLEFTFGPPVYIEPIVTNHGVEGIMCGNAAGCQVLGPSPIPPAIKTLMEGMQ